MAINDKQIGIFALQSHMKKQFIMHNITVDEATSNCFCGVVFFFPHFLRSPAKKERYKNKEETRKSGVASRRC